MWPSPEKGESILAEMIQQIKRDGRERNMIVLSVFQVTLIVRFLQPRLKSGDCVHWLFTLMRAGILSWR